MRIQYLGTAAGEGIPGLFCNCDVCKKMRKLGGKNLRARTQAVIDGDMLIDYSPDTYFNCLRFGIDLSKIKHLLITHTHLDHFAPAELELRGKGYAVKMSEPILTVYGTKAVGEKLKKCADNLQTIEFVELKLFEPTKIDDYTVTALPAVHMLGSGEQSVIFLIEKKGKTILYCNDTGLDKSVNQLPTSIIDYFVANNIKLDFIGFDCTYGVNYDPWGQHLAFCEIDIIIKKFREEGFITDKTILYATHFSHWHVLEHEQLVEHAKQYGLKVAYDGIVIEV
jgi:phosphoribosyl 1,2-cyclic phosphate phosphodiesterase